MHEIDAAIMDGTLTREMLERHAEAPELPPIGASYWADAMRDRAPFPAPGQMSRARIAAAELACIAAARQMGAALASLRSAGIA